MGSRPLVTAERVRALLEYDPATGIFRSRVHRGPLKPGDVVGTTNENGYRQIQLDGRIYYGHRLAWLWMTGQWPTHEIDHIDTDTGNNRWANLRDVDSTTNHQNKRRAHRTNKLGLLGVSAHTTTPNCWVSRIRIGRRYQHLGCFPSPEAAHAAYVAAKAEHHPGATQ